MKHQQPDVGKIYLFLKDQTNQSINWLLMEEKIQEHSLIHLSFTNN